jgi:hypothetical protein
LPANSNNTLLLSLFFSKTQFSETTQHAALWLAAFVLRQRQRTFYPLKLGLLLHFCIFICFIARLRSRPINNIFFVHHHHQQQHP